MPPKIIHFDVDEAPIRLDQFLVKMMRELSRSQIKKLIRQGEVQVGGQTAKPATPVQHGDRVSVRVPEPPPTALAPQNLPLEVLFEDDDVLVVNKAAGMVVHPAHGHAGGTLVNALLGRYPDLAAMTQLDPDSVWRPGVVHRLDQDTSGVMVLARTPEALRHLQRQFKQRTVGKTYLALVFGHPQAAEGIIDVPLGRDPANRQKFAPRPDGKPARTHYRVQAGFAGYSLLVVGLETGRTHQIRVHLAWLKCPVVGDAVYGRKKNPLGLRRQFLHAWKLAFRHPRTDKTVAFEAPLPPELAAVLARLEGA